MKIVRGYTTDSQLLVQGHTDLVAKVGDIVRLYLDTVADPALPAFIRATIEHPIVPKNNCTRTAYSFAYDESLLNGALTRLRHEDIVGVLVYSTQGRSVYESYLLTTNDEPPLSESAWTDTVLRGPQGPTGPTGPQGATGPSGAIETTTSILTKLGGATPLASKIGEEYLPPEWYAEIVTAAAPGEFNFGTIPTAAWWDHVVECAYNVSLPFDAETYTGKKFMLKTSAAIIIDGAVLGSFPANITIPAAANFEYRLTLIESIGGIWMATLNYSGVPAGGGASSLNIDGGSPSSNYTSIPAIDGGTP